MTQPIAAKTRTGVPRATAHAGVLTDERTIMNCTATPRIAMREPIVRTAELRQF